MRALFTSLTHFWTLWVQAKCLFPLFLPFLPVFPSCISHLSTLPVLFSCPFNFCLSFLSLLSVSPAFFPASSSFLFFLDDFLSCLSCIFFLSFLPILPSSFLSFLGSLQFSYFSNFGYFLQHCKVMPTDYSLIFAYDLFVKLCFAHSGFNTAVSDFYCIFSNTKFFVLTPFSSLNHIHTSFLFLLFLIHLAPPPFLPHPPPLPPLPVERKGFHLDHNLQISRQ
jgi:hypothetical protein